jgi:hypothetical protein
LFNDCLTDHAPLEKACQKSQSTWMVFLWNKRCN